MSRIFLSLSLAVVALLPAAGLRAQANCGPTDQVLQRLQAVYGETTIWVGADRKGRQLAITGQTGGGSFTVLQLQAGTACIAATGFTWAAMEPGRATPGEEH
ncbi:MAG: hypothetical protein AAF230_00120 [Pseudomonadota bacterium]